MSVIRINKNKNYTVMSNKHLKDKSLSLKAKGLLSVMLSLPDNWNYSIEGLIKICKEGERAIKNTLDELKENKYLIITKLYPNQTKNGRIEYIYDIYEQPIKNNIGVNINKKQEVHFVGVENVGLQNAGQLNTNNKKLNIKENVKRKNFEQRIYSDEELNELYTNFDEQTNVHIDC